MPPVTTATSPSVPVRRGLAPDGTGRFHALDNLRAAISVDATNHVAVIVEAGPGHFDDESDSGRLWIALAMVTNSPRVTTRSDCVAAECPAGLVTTAVNILPSRNVLLIKTLRRIST